MKSTRDTEFREFVRERRPRLLRTATLLTAGDQHAAEDLVQTALTKLYVAWPAFQRATNPTSYVHRVMVNALVDETRRPWRRHEVRVAEVPEHAAPSTGSAGEAVTAALQKLSPGMRSIVVLRYFQDLSVAQCAEVVGCSQGNVKSQSARALAHLRATLGAGITFPAEPGEPPGTSAPVLRPAIAHPAP